MADAVVKYAEHLAATTAPDTTWVDLAVIAASEFEANKTYLIIANQAGVCASSTDQIQVRLVHGTTPTEFTDGFLSSETNANAQEGEMSFLFLYTQPGTAELIKIQISSNTVATGTITNRLSQIIAIKLSDDFTQNTDWFWAEDLTNYTMTATPTAKATTGSFTPNGTDRWLFIGHMTHDVVTIVDEIGFELYDSVAGVLSLFQAEGEDATNDIRANNLFWVGVPTNAARTLAVRPFEEAGSNIMLASRVFAINLSKFAQSVSAFSATEVNPATTPTYTTVATVAPTPDVTGDWVVIAFSTNDNNNYSAEDFKARLQIDASGGGLVNDPDFGSTVPGQNEWDSLDEIPLSVFNLVSLSSGAARTINYDWSHVVGTAGRIEDNGLVAFSVALAGATPALPFKQKIISQAVNRAATY